MLQDLFKDLRDKDLSRIPRRVLKDLAKILDAQRLILDLENPTPRFDVKIV